MKYIFTSGFLCLILVIGSCSKDETKQPPIPEVVVNFYINPNSTEYLELNAPGGWIYVTGGYRGILIYRLSLTEFLAF